ncbi:MAG: sialidase family protein [Caldilineaceae bacterium]|nr:sialidase family protein [Caldilineaceae bacterium]MDE0337721.1 sialidase family protein [Caldilineaceae bacterium]
MAQEVELGGLRFTAGTPLIVAEGLGFCWYPSIRRFPTGELLVSYSKNPDSAENLTNVNGISLSKDEGATWTQHADVSGLSGRLNISLPDGSLAGPNQPYKPEPLGQWRTFVGNYGSIGKGGQQYSVDLWGSRLEGLPRDAKARTVQSPTRWAEISPFTDIIELEPGRHLSTTYLTFAGDDRYSTVVMTSEDEGRTWHYLSTVATADDGADSWEGFCESSLVRLEDGDLMCVGRMGGGRDQLLARSYSSDEGKSWSPIDRLPAWGVLPQVKRLSNGALVISCGRPGLFIWFSTDPRGEHWVPFDLMAHHNAEMGEAHQISPGKYGLEPVTREQYYTVHHNFDQPDQTTSYTSMLEVEPGRLLIVYDRMPYGWMPVPTDAEVRSRILARYAVSNLAPDSMTPDERERIYLLELEM